MKHAFSEPYYTYTNHELRHYSTIDHCITTRNIFDRIIKCYVRCDPLNPSSITLKIYQLLVFTMMFTLVLIDCNQHNYLSVLGTKHIQHKLTITGTL